MDGRRGRGGAGPGARTAPARPALAVAAALALAPGCRRDPADVAELSARAHRALAHGDGAACLAALDELGRASPTTERALGMTRGQCELAAGRCQAGKARLVRLYQDDLAFSPERAARAAEALVALHCSGGDATPRDRLLRAHQRLTHGAYLDRVEPAVCLAALAEVEALTPGVPVDDPDDPLRGQGQALFHTAAQCLARAGDCAGARAAHARHFPATAGLDAALRRETIAAAFDSAVTRCAAGRDGGSP